MTKLYYEIFCAYIPDSDDEDIYETKIIYKTKIFETIPPPDFIPTNENNYQKIFIAGGGSIGLNVAKLLEETHNIRIIELSEDRAKYLSEKLNNTLVLQGNASDEDLLKDEGIENTDVSEDGTTLDNDTDNNNTEN